MTRFSDSVPELIQSLCIPGVLETQFTGQVELIETHISYVLLTADFAYKIKKPVNLGFVDFSTLQKREYYCGEELRLNRRFSEALYIDRIKITGSVERPLINGEGDCLDYAVKMKRFDQSQELGRLIHQQAVEHEKFWSFASDLAQFHEQADVAEINSRFAAPDGLRQRAMTNFKEVKNAIRAPELIKRVELLEHWTEQSLLALAPLFDKRKREGRIRECHGDLHLANLVMLDQKIVPFDCLEFNEDFRWIDVASELAFLLMDLKANGFKEYARVVLNGYLEASGDYELVQLLRHYTVYRSMVRAKVACLRDVQMHKSSDSDVEFIKYLEIAEQSEKQPFSGQVIIAHGLSGCGKTWLSKRLLEVADLILIRSDIVRKKIHNSGADQDSHNSVQQGVYSTAEKKKVYQTLLAAAEKIVNAGYPVIVDATFLKQKQRRQFRDLAEDCGVPFKILDIQASRRVLESRIIARQLSGSDASEADTSVLTYQMETAEPLLPDEQFFVVRIDSEKDWCRERLFALARLLELD